MVLQVVERPTPLRPSRPIFWPAWISKSTSSSRYGPISSAITARASRAALVGAAAGFLPFNWSRASVFLGDCGSYLLGFTLAALPLLAPSHLRSQAAVFVGVSLWLFLADATWTLVPKNEWDVAAGAALVAAGGGAVFGPDGDQPLDAEAVAAAGLSRTRWRR